MGEVRAEQMYKLLYNNTMAEVRRRMISTLTPTAVARRITSCSEPPDELPRKRPSGNGQKWTRVKR